VNILEAISLSIGGFAATNIDDLFILMVFFANSSFRTFQIILGQYIGMSLLLTVSLLGSLIVFVIPYNLIGLVGLFPIVIGIKVLVGLQNTGVNDKNYADNKRITNQLSKNRWRVSTYFQFMLVATVTFSGGEEIGIYTSIFVIHNSLSEIVVIIMVVMLLTGIWCAISIYIVKHGLVATYFRRISKWVLPFVLIGIGIYILTEEFLIPSGII
jgi:cadmium resistance protein CadD (predicted permease)